MINVICLFLTLVLKFGNEDVLILVYFKVDISASSNLASPPSLFDRCVRIESPARHKIYNHPLHVLFSLRMTKINSKYTTGRDNIIKHINEKPNRTYLVLSKISYIYWLAMQSISQMKN